MEFQYPNINIGHPEYGEREVKESNKGTGRRNAFNVCYPISTC